MQVFSKKTFDFGGGVRIGKNEFGWLPEAAKKTKLFQWALKDGNIRILGPDAKEKEKPSPPAE